MSPGEPMRNLIAYLTVLAGPEPAGAYFALRYRVDRDGLRPRFIEAARPTEAAARSRRSAVPGRLRRLRAPGAAGRVAGTRSPKCGRLRRAA
jgi:hypothetical protein